MHSGRFFNTSKQAAQEKIEQLLNTIENRDKNALKKLFSEKALTEAENIDENIVTLFDFIQGEVISYSMDGGLYSAGEREYGDVRKELQVSFEFVTSVDTYQAAIMFFPLDNFDSSNVGIYSFYVRKKAQTNDYNYRGDGLWTVGITVDPYNVDNRKRWKQSI